MNEFKGQNRRRSATLAELFTNWDKDSCPISTLVQEYVFDKYGREYCKCWKQDGIIHFVNPHPLLIDSKLPFSKEGSLVVAKLTDQEIKAITPIRDFKPLTSFRKVKKYFTSKGQNELKQDGIDSFCYKGIQFRIEEYFETRRLVIPSKEILREISKDEKLENCFK